MHRTQEAMSPRQASAVRTCTEAMAATMARWVCRKRCGAMAGGLAVDHGCEGATVLAAQDLEAAAMTAGSVGLAVGD